VATVLYISGLVIGVIFYFIESRSPASAELLKTSWSSLLGLLAGVWAAGSVEE
jgi:xanthosine utilization system XapX-like protein